MMYISSFAAILWLSAVLLMAAPANAASAPTEQGAAAHIGAGVGSGVPAKISPDTDAQRRLIERGRYLALASDCAACHTVRDGTGKGDFAGGYVFKLSMGRIVSGNITPSGQFGIGNWSEAEFARAVREGVRPGGTHLYPAMPYPEYSVMTDADMEALYAYFMQAVPAIDASPRQQTKMHFPFNLPGALAVWNALFLNYERYKPALNLSGLINRGRFLADGPAHCGTCHTPRNFMMAADKARYMGGAELNGWRAPNITSDRISGLGGWSEEEIIRYLQTGHIRDKSQANGPMAEAVEFSFRYMTKGDLRAIAAYLKTVPPLSTPGQTEPAYTQHEPADASFAQYEIPFGGAASAYSSESGTLDGALLYNTACASCHGANGEGAADASSPSLLANRAVGSVNADSLIMTVAYGLYRQGADKTVSMPGFLNRDNPIYAAMNTAQIAAVVNYVRGNFGRREEKITAADVETSLTGGRFPFLIEHAALLAALGFLAGLAVLLVLARHFLFRGRAVKRTRSAAENIVQKTEAALSKASSAAEKPPGKTEKAAAKPAAPVKAGAKAAAGKAVKTVQSAKQKTKSGAAKPKPKPKPKPKKKPKPKPKKKQRGISGKK